MPFPEYDKSGNSKSAVVSNKDRLWIDCLEAIYDKLCDIEICLKQSDESETKIIDTSKEKDNDSTG